MTLNFDVKVVTEEIFVPHGFFPRAGIVTGEDQRGDFRRHAAAGANQAFAVLFEQSCVNAGTVVKAFGVADGRELDKVFVTDFIFGKQKQVVGIFAAAPIKAGDPIWILEERFDLLLPATELAMLPTLQREFIERYGYPHMTRPGFVVLEFDNGRFMNHCDAPNTDFRNSEIAWATRDIAEGEELTCNYAEFDPSFEMQPGRNFLMASPDRVPAKGRW